MTEEIQTGFDVFDLNAELRQGIAAAGFKVPSPIQEKAIPLVLSGVDVIAQAHTGTGKTAAFALPAMNGMTKSGAIELLVITPTRELAAQVSDEIFRLGRFAGIHTGTIYGGQSYERQLKLINRGLQVITATPGRLLDLLKSGKLANLNPSIVVLDEADEMLDMGFLEDIREIFTYLPEERQTLLFSATMPAPIQHLAKSILKSPVIVKTLNERESTNSDISQSYYVIEEREREEAVIRLIEDQCPDKTIVFCRTRLEVDRLSNSLGARGYNAKALHGDMEQSQRNMVMQAFRQSQIDILVATDVAARGLDVADVSHVFNYHMPFDTKSYIHRVGRTGRAGKKGHAITLVTPMEFRQLTRIERSVGMNLECRPVPSLQDLRQSRMARLKEQLLQCEVKPEALELVQSLEGEMDPAILAQKLVSMFLDQQQETGPNQIGLDQRRVEQLKRQGFGQGNSRNYRGNPRRGNGQNRSYGGGGSRSGGQNRSYGGGGGQSRSYGGGSRSGGQNRPQGGSRGNAGGSGR
jgi:ATP-dependent RNA helicase DeaD